MRWWALASGVSGLVADLLLLAFYAVAQPWTDAPPESWLGTANDYVMIVQFAALVPVVFGLARLLPAGRRTRVWTAVGAIACVAVAGLQALLVTGVLAFDVQVGLVVPAIVAAMLWAGMVSDRSVLSPVVRRVGRILLAGVPVAALVFLAGTIVSATAGVGWAWAAGGVIGMIVWFLFPLWAVLLGLTTAAQRPQPVAVG